MHRKPHIPIAFLLILLASWGLMLINIELPWWEQGSDNGAWISGVVRNYDRYGAVNIGFVQILNYEPATPDTYEYYMHHPPMIVWQTYVTRQLFGFHEASFRYLAAIMTLISSVAMYVLIRRLTHNESQALWGMALYAFTPMMLFYGRMPDHEAPALAFVLLLFAVLVNLSIRVTRARLLACTLLIFLCAWTAWAVLIFIGLAGVWLLWLNPKRNWKMFLGFGMVAIASVVLLITYYQSQYPDTINDLMSVFVHRTSNQELSRGSANFTFVEFLWQNFIHILLLFTPSLLFLMGIGWIFARGRGTRRTNGMIIALLGSALVYFLVFRNATYIHNYYKIYLAPFLALSASFAMVAHQAYRGRKQRVTSAVMRGFILGGIITGGFSFGLFHQSAVRPQLEEARALLAEQSQAGDFIYTNLDYGVKPLAFYSSTIMDGNRTPETILSRLESDTEFAYLYCDTENDEDIEFTIPDVLAAYEAVASETCFYIRFDDGTDKQGE